MSLPSRFLLYIDSRSATKDPFAGYVLVDTVYEIDAWKLNVVPTGSPTILVGHPNIAYTSNKRMQFRPPSHPPTSQPFSLWIKHIATIAQLESASTPVPVYMIAAAPTLYLPRRQKRNVRIKSLPGTPHGPQTNWVDASGGHYTPTPTPPTTSPSSWGDANGGQYISHEYNVPVRSPPRIVDPFVARQLLELAQLKHEICPITAEEYITGQTAVMPCGHLFMRMAIEETFKKEANKCPACRQTGAPQFV